MIIIILVNGKALINDPDLGFNSKSVEEIKACLEEFGEYHLTCNGIKYNILKRHVLEIIEQI